MTLIVGIKCSDGVVIAADSAATLGNALGEQTVREAVPKLQILENRIVLGVSGPVGLGQLFADRVKVSWSQQGGLKGVKSVAEAMRLIRDAIRQDAMAAIQGAAAAAPMLGGVARIGAITSTLVALPVAGTPELIQFDYQGMPEAATGNLPYVSIGIGQPLADPFLAFLRNVFWERNSLPKLADAVFAAVWTLEHAIKIAPGNVAGPTQIAILESKGSTLVARVLLPQELEEHKQNVHGAEQHLALYSKPQELTSQPPEPPTLSQP